VPDTATAPLRLADPDTFAGGVPHDRLAELRRTEPVSWQEMDGEPGFWALLTHADVQHASQQPRLFSSEGGIVLEDTTPENLEMSRGTLVGMDPPRHGGHRTPLAPTFTRRAIGRLEGQVEALCREIVEEARALGPRVDLVHDLSGKLPSRVVGRLMGLPEADWPYIHGLSEQMLSGQDPEVAQHRDGGAMVEMAGYAMAFAASRRADEPRGDLTDVLLHGEFDGRTLTDLDIAGLFCQLVAAGNDTTKTLTASAVVALLRHPDQMAIVRTDPSVLPSAVEEVLRWAPPVHYMRRTATAATTLHGVDIAAGDKVALYYSSANRDDVVFDEPDRLDVRRHPNRHLSFGIAEHFCLGAHLARLEARVFLREVLAAFPSIALAGDPVRLRSNLVNGYRLVPVDLG
jgi:cytochrome P450